MGLGTGVWSNFDPSLGLKTFPVLTVDTSVFAPYFRRPDTRLDSGDERRPVLIRDPWKGSDIEVTEIRLKKGESVEKALRRLKKKIDREGTLKEVRTRRHFEKPSERKRRKMKVARFSAMLTARYADL